jgi:omega-6 fatty acid desaturase (delta-12 desaturase)
MSACFETQHQTDQTAGSIAVLPPLPPPPPAPAPPPSAGVQYRLSRRGVELLHATKNFAREHRVWSWWHLGSTIAAVAGSMALAALPLPWPVRIVLSGIVALCLVRLFIIYHDHSHGTILRRSKMASLIMHAYGLLTLNPPSAWKRSHNHHHKNNAKIFGASVGSFPVMTREGFAQARFRQRAFYVVSRHPLTILFGYWTVFVYGMCLKPLLINPRRHIDCAFAVTLQLAIILVGARLAPHVYLFAYLIPMAGAAALGAYLFYSQHNFPGVKLPGRANWDFVDAALLSSSYTAMGPVMRWFTGNIGYHHVHHLNAHIPFYRLPEAMAKIRELQSVKPIRLWPLDVYRCFRLKLWDVKQDRMVSWNGR